MNELENSLQMKATSELQRYLKSNMFNKETAVIAQAILKERGAAIPEPIPEEALEESYSKARSNSNKKFLVVIFTIVGWAVYAYATGLFEEGQGKRLEHSVFVTGLFLATELGWIVLGSRGGSRRKK